MNLYLISQDTNQNSDTYDSAVVAAVSENDARNIHPNGKKHGVEYDHSAWVKSRHLINVKCLDKTELPRGVVLASFNAG